MQLGQVKEIAVVDTREEANNLLSQGWDLFTVVPKSSADNRLGATYVMAKYS